PGGSTLSEVQCGSGIYLPNARGLGEPITRVLGTFDRQVPAQCFSAIRRTRLASTADAVPYRHRRAGAGSDVWVPGCRPAIHREVVDGSMATDACGSIRGRSAVG